MNNYEFANLSPLRFEQLARDLLKEKYGVFENFAEGKDAGIDFRYSQADDKILIVQCKRYKNPASLMASLKKEAEKVKKLHFTDYILVVSLDLSDKKKEEVLKIYDGKIKLPGQIITKGDLNFLLGLPANHYIEFKYPELWMNSINVHQKIFQLGFLQHSEFIKDKIKESLKNFVPYKEYYDLNEYLKDNNVAIISGNPGIGKTTLSHVVISQFIYYENYRLIDLSYRKIQEAESFINSNEPTIFLVDDFLGKIKLDKDNDYVQLLLYFIEKIEKCDNKKLIITTREYILRKANKELSPVNDINQRILKYVITIKSFTRRIRTEILYNHLKNSSLQGEYIDNFLQNDYLRIIDHKNYNPRIIEHLANARLLKDIKAADYFDFFMGNLEKPNKVWEMVYNNLPNDLYKLILLVRFIISEKIPIDKFEKCILEFVHKSDKFRMYGFDDFDYVMQEMEGTFFRFETGYDDMSEEEFDVVEFHDPSIIDFIDSFVWKKNSWLQLIIKNAIYFEQLFNWELLEAVRQDETLLKAFRKKVIEDFNKLVNAGFGYFEYYAEEEGSFNCLKQCRYIYYLHEAYLVIDIKKDKEFGDFLKKELFKHKGFDDISEKIAFSQVVSGLIEIGIVDGQSAIRQFIGYGDCDDIKELVFFEYMTRSCRKQDLAVIESYKTFVDNADYAFLDVLEDIKEMSFVSVIELLDDFEQVKKILPLLETSRKFKELNWQQILQEAHESDLNDDDDDEETDDEQTKDKYNDIDDETIKHIIEKIRKL